MQAKKLLIVEDDSFTRGTLAASLLKAGFASVQQAGTVTEALSAFDESNPDVCLIDLDLGPGPTGIDLAELIRKKNPKVGVVILTSYLDPRLHHPRITRLPAGTQYLVKQSLTDISQIVSTLLDSINQSNPFIRRRDQLGRSSFTEVQLETMKLIAAGHTNAEIAKRRHVSEKAIEKTIRLISAQFDEGDLDGKNVRVAITRAYLELTGGKG